MNLARQYADYRSITLGTLGTYLTRDAKFFNRLAEGRVTIRRAERAIEWLSDHWPADLDWPADIPRPEPCPDGEKAA